jgi:hypothetical protein
MQGAFLAQNPTWESMVADTTKLANIVLLSELFVSLVRNASSASIS